MEKKTTKNKWKKQGEQIDEQIGPKKEQEKQTNE